MNKPTQNQFPIHDLLRDRWSPRAFASRFVEPEKLSALFEAARWSPSAANIQPWSFLVTTKEEPEAFSKLLGTLAEKNQRWAKLAPVLILTVSRRVKEDGGENRWAGYDLGQSMAHLSVEATNLGLSVHQMGGFDAERARNEFEIPEEFDILTVVAIGYPGNPEDLPEDFRERELAPRIRRELSEFVFESTWKRPFLRRDRDIAGVGGASRN